MKNVKKLDSRVQPPSPKKVIESIRKEVFGLDKYGRPSHLSTQLLGTFENLLTIVSNDIYSSNVHFIYELIQNAQDNTYPHDQINSLKFVLLDYDPTNSEGSEGCLCVFNNEVGFSQDDIGSICSAGDSTKKKKKMEGYIGEKGIGFKSVFRISSYPHIFSNGYQIRFTDQDKEAGLSYIIPYWVDETPKIVATHEGLTSILLPIQAGKYDEIRKALMAHEPEVSLFLSNLHSIEIEIPRDEFQAVFRLRKEDEKFLYLDSDLGGTKSSQKYWLSTSKVVVPGDLIEPKREGVHSRTISVAYPLEGSIIKHSIFAYLPTEMQTGLPFIINADFLMVSNRESFNESKWNDWLLEEIGKLLGDDIAKMVKDDRMGNHAFNYVPFRSEVEKIDKRFTVVCDLAIECIRGQRVIRDCEGAWQYPKDCIVIPEMFRELFSGCPNVESEKYWVHPSLDKYVRALLALGTRFIKKNERLAYFQQADWISKQPDEWFLFAYKYVLLDKTCNFDTEDVTQLPIIRADDGSVHTSDSGVVFLPAEGEASIDVPSGGFFPKFLIFNESLFKAVNSKSNLKANFSVIFNLPEFTHENYFDNILLPTLREKVGDSTLAEKKKLIRYVVGKWDQLGYGDFCRSSDHDIPILLEGGEIVFLDSQKLDVSILAPRTKSSSWGVVFSDSELESTEILHQAYGEVDSDDFGQFCEDADILEFPEPPLVELSGISSLGGNYSSYDSFINMEFFNSSSYPSQKPKSGRVNILPHIFWSLESRGDAVRNAFIGYLEYLLVECDGSWEKSPFVRFAENEREYSLQSPLFYTLLNSPWILTTRGYRKPTECFAKNKNLQIILGDSVPYVLDRFSSDLLIKLAIPNDAGIDTVLNYIRELSKSSNKPGADLGAIYRNLANQDSGGELETIFATETLIYIPCEPNGEWRSSGELIWEDVSDITDDSFRSLQQYYPDELRSFFVDSLKVKETIDPESYADLWRNLQKVPILDGNQIKLFSRAFNKIRQEIRANHNQEWLTRFREDALLYTDQKRWVTLDGETPPFLPDDEVLRRAFLHRVPYVYRFDDYSYGFQSTLTDFLGVEKLSEVVKVSLVNGAAAGSRKPNDYLTEYSAWMLCYAIANRGADGADNLKILIDDGRIETLFSLQEIVVTKLQLTAAIPYTSISVALSDTPVFCDYENRLIYIERNTDREDVLDILASEMAKFLSSRIARATEYEDTFRRYFAIGTEMAYKKQLDRKATWHLPRDLRKFITAIAKDNAYVPDDPVPSSPEVDLNAGTVSTPKSGGESAGDAQGGTVTETPSSGPLSGSKGIGSAGSARPSNTPSMGGGKDSSGGNAQTTLEEAHPRASSPSAHGQRVGSRGRRSRSDGLASSVNQARRSKLRSYVQHGTETDSDTKNGDENQRLRDEMGEQGELIVLEDLKHLDFVVERMPAFNKGYDLEAIDPNSGELLYIEVKSDSFGWSDKGVGLTSAQYKKASESRGAYVLAVVENLRSPPYSISYVRDPISRISEYRFDQGWAELAEKLGVAKAQGAELSASQKLQKLTDFQECRDIIAYCEENEYPLPEVGLELMNHVGEVVYETIELAWEEDRVAVVADASEVGDIFALDQSWICTPMTDSSDVCALLDKKFGE